MGNANTENRLDFTSDKILQVNHDDLKDKLTHWISLYFHTQVKGGSEHTTRAKKMDLEKFLCFYVEHLGHEHIDGWTPSVSKGFQRFLGSSYLSSKNQHLSATSINRIIATVRHLGNWIHKQRPLVAGNPFHSVKDIALDTPAWNGLTDKEIMRLKVACDQRAKICDRKNQNPRLEVAVFYCLLYTGLRESELSSLNMGQYHHGGFHQVKRKGKKITRKVPLPSEAKSKLDEYLENRVGEKGVEENQPLFLSRYGNRLHPRDIYRVMERICKQASAQLPENEKMRLSPHMLRHSFLKRVADKQGIHVAQALSGNVSMREVFRYTSPSQDEVDEIVEKII
jgi:integrase/recombinase XerD